ncbi:ATP-dependent DNA helicase RecG [Microcoleus sp. FACHB-1515]|uniref:ATP-dependent DNA helicase RecG n=1 Tax=Cyanophyceae TaxID=3028117 RepID=UPI00168767CF|nr:ATP-dependent DNA helicase RecG [Microcoleus sp. FACHB-1515]MBD2093263.1 ATP-dependent DNA helicase RecG [Microcoleus sp. FACHB-1515]
MVTTSSFLPCHFNAVQQAQLAKLKIASIRDLLYYFPRDYIDYKLVSIAAAAIGETVAIVATIGRHRITNVRNDRLLLQTWEIKDATGRVRCTQFHRSACRSQFWRHQQHARHRPSTKILVCGKVYRDSYSGQKAIKADRVTLIDFPTTVEDSIIQAVYALKSGVDATTLQACIQQAIAHSSIDDPLPHKIQQHYGLVDLATAIAHLHQPPNRAALKAARDRIAFDELFYLQLGLLLRRQSLRAQSRSIAPLHFDLLDRFYDTLPFALTGAQQRVIAEIQQDFAQPYPMNRLVQGDVGSGKTVVAAAALLLAIATRQQAALMAPTEVLAEQHYRSLCQWLMPLGISTALLTGSTSLADRRRIYAALRSGELPLIIGTHALIQKSVQFQQLGLVIIDEQHRFGVNQRLCLQQKGDRPHVLTMTATPIPRTLALTLHGDLDISQIDELPPGRQAIETTVLTPDDRDRAYALIRRELSLRRQVYIVLPLVAESEKLDLKSAIEEHQHLQDVIFPQFKVGLLHGRMTSAEKDDAIEQFRQNQTQILVSTTVVEVGVDVPNATVMLIEHAERFGLSQLHQLRGRVGRGVAQSFCLLINTAANENSAERLAVLSQSQDGFFIAEMDMHTRGTGEVLGYTQAGVPTFTVANLDRDRHLLLKARQAAEKVAAKSTELQSWNVLYSALQEHYPHLDIGDRSN